MKLSLNGIKRIGRVAKIKLNKNAPDIAIIAGVGTMIAGTVMACKATLRVDEIRAEAAEIVEKIDETLIKRPDDYTEEEAKHDKLIVAGQTAIKLAKNYAPAAIMIGGGAVSIILGNRVHRKRMASMTASLAAVTESFRGYRKRVAEKYGDEAERQIRYNLKSEKIEETEVGADGKEKKVKKTANNIGNDDSVKYSPYAVVFDSASREWSKDPNQNFMFLRAQQKIANAKLIANGYLFLNDVLDALDLPETEAGHYVGWIYDMDDPVGDNFIDFGIFDIRKESVRDFQNGYERDIILDFNVDGPIVDRVKWGG